MAQDKANVTKMREILESVKLSVSFQFLFVNMSHGIYMSNIKMKFYECLEVLYLYTIPWESQTKRRYYDVTFVYNL